jgi:hypothetical protein
VVDKHHILYFVPSKTAIQKFEQIFEVNSYSAIPSDIADATLLGNVLLVISKNGRVFYNYDNSFFEFDIIGPNNTALTNGVSVAEASSQSGILAIFAFTRDSYCQILVCLNFDEAIPQAHRGPGVHKPQRLQLLTCFRSKLRDLAGNLFEVRCV